MDFRGLLFVMFVVLNVVCAALISAAQEDSSSYNQVHIHVINIYLSILIIMYCECAKNEIALC